MYLPYTGCFTRRSILTVMVLSILSLTTRPCRVRVAFLSVPLLFRLLLQARFSRARCPRLALLEQVALP